MYDDFHGAMRLFIEAPQRSKVRDEEEAFQEIARRPEAAGHSDATTFFRAETIMDGFNRCARSRRPGSDEWLVVVSLGAARGGDGPKRQRTIAGARSAADVRHPFLGRPAGGEICRR